MNIAYLISSHTDAPQLKRLIEALHPEAHFFIHIDKKSDITQFTSVIKGENIHFIPNRVDVLWGTIIEVEYQMNLLRAAVEHPVTFDRIFFLSGMDYPVWSNEEITSYLKSLGEKEILQGIQMDSGTHTSEQTRLYRIARPLVTLRFLNKKQNANIRILLRKCLQFTGYRKKLCYTSNGKTIHLYKGSAWWCITENLARYILQEYEHNNALRCYFKNSFGQAETLIQTIAFNSEQFASKCILTEGRYPGLAALTPLHFIDYNPVIQIMTEADIDRVRESGKMFCRKVISGKSDEFVRLISSMRRESL